jgi:hypothetical protein
MRGGEAVISLAAAARLWRVSRATVYEWHAAGRVSFFRTGRRGLEAHLRDVRAAKVLSEPALQAIVQHRIPAQIVSLAVQNAIVVPEEGRCSLDDVDALRQFADVGQRDLAPPTRFDSTWYVLNMTSRRLNGTNGAARHGDTPKRRKGRATKAQQQARGRFLAELAKKGAVPSEHEVQAILRELEGG